MKQLYTRLTAALMAVLMVLALAGCQKAGDKMDQAVYDTLDKVQDVGNPEYKSYQEVLDAYSKKMEQKGASLAKELTKEAPARYKQDGNTLTKLLKEKTQALNEVYQEGLKQLSQIMLFSEESRDIYESHEETLYSSYRKAESVIMDAYTEALSNVQ